MACSYRKIEEDSQHSEEKRQEIVAKKEKRRAHLLMELDYIKTFVDRVTKGHITEDELSGQQPTKKQLKELQGKVRDELHLIPVYRRA